MDTGAVGAVRICMLWEWVMPQSHILAAFDRELDQMQALLLQLGTLVETAIGDAARALETRNADLAEKVRQGDKVIDALEDRIQADCARIIALRGPTARDLRAVLAVMKMAATLERCGDYAKNLAKRSLLLPETPALSGAISAIRRAAEQVAAMLKAALGAYVARDAEAAAEIRRRDRDVDQIYSALFRELLTHMMEDPRNITPAMHLHFIAKNIERVGDHATTLAEQVIYLVTGTLPDEARPKVDVTDTGRA